MRIPDICSLPAGATVWAYLRDSGGTNQDRSVDQQLEIVREYCARHHLVLERVFADAARQGDSTDSRAELWKLLEDRLHQVANAGVVIGADRVRIAET